MFVSYQYDVFCVSCMFYWQIRQFSLGCIQFLERCFLCVLHVLLTDSSIFARLHSVSRRITSQKKKEEYISSVVTNFQISSKFILEKYTFVSCQYDVFCVSCMFYWQIRQFSLGCIQFLEELHLSKRKKNIFPV